MKRLGPYLIGGVIALLVAYLLLPAPPAPPEYTRVIVKREVIEAAEPDTVVRFVERIRVVTPPPQVIAIAPGGATGLVASFCSRSVRLAAGDSTPTAPRLLLRSGELERGWFLSKDRLTLTGPTSTGDLVQATWGTRGSTSFVTVGDSVLVRYDRWAIPKRLLEYALVAALVHGALELVPR